MTATTKKKRVPKPAVASTALTGKEKREWKELVEAAYGSLSWVDYSVDEYLREKRTEVERENNS